MSAPWPARLSTGAGHEWVLRVEPGGSIAASRTAGIGALQPVADHAAYGRRCPFAVTRCDQRRRPVMHLSDISFDAYLGRIIGSHALSFARTMRRRRAPERHDGHWGLAAGARAGTIRAGFPRERDRPARPAGADGR